ncbi:uncharacterized protein Z520_09852 [Fonsecaea multimorphosa CBS 102226]|uniref:Uncharacterized protein n=1 Tax=Fonsecaea multimorphosa CBS 102226 TaxID=1442371 RepID=A0A0D2IBE9_9EURO|nr:uncharacterized protein Z520_09852 [Fonsecaea multimorphosa CBS 102226]KIX94466.1 hypothetical protein Z520_09852 [Fonsecaea multimorphosa CBS 102226]OAL20045.1 hypothetical protein AYO22_09195 [Fonsecaea multimorphosa]
MINLGLKRITQLLNPLFSAYPTLPWKAVHIAGTNGKGSVAALVTTFLGHLGYRVGRFTSPHLIDRWDCITLNKRVVERDLYLQVEQHFRDRSARENIDASEFEILTATAFQIFTDAKVDVAVIECGLGGRLDATNVLRPEDVVASVLTKVGLDHTDFLGDSLEAVTREKVGIFKPGVPVVLDQSNLRNVLDVAESRLKDLGWGENGTEGVYISVEERRREFGEVIFRLGLAQHQGQNLYVAFSCLRLADARLSELYAGRQDLPTEQTPAPLIFPRDYLVSTDRRRSEAVKQSLEILVPQAQSSLPGRLQWLVLPPELVPQNLDQMTGHLQGDTYKDDIVFAQVLVDGAHNPQSAAALAAYVRLQWRRINPPPHLPVTWLLSVKNDKKADDILMQLLRPNDNVVTCSFGPVDGMPWVKSMGAIDLAKLAMKYTNGIVEALTDECIEGILGHDKVTPYEKMMITIRQAVSIASRESGGSNLDLKLCITGSLYLVGDVLRCVRDTCGSEHGLFRPKP